MKIPDCLLKNLTYFIFSIYILILALFSNAGFPTSMFTADKMPYLVDKPIGEDAYYMLTVSKHLAEGRGLTYNFDKETTGIQPLATFIYATIYKISSIFKLDDWHNLRLILLFNSILLMLFSITLVKISAVISPETKYLYMMIPLLTLFNFGLFRTFTYGLETGLYLLFFSLTVYYTIKIDFKYVRFKQTVLLAILIGITTLARIDFIVILIIFFLIQLLTKRITIKNLLIISAISVLITLPWFIYVFKVTGSFLPSSGTAQSELITIQNLSTRFLSMLKAIIENLTPWIYTGARNIVVLGAIISLFILGIIFWKSMIGSIVHFKNFVYKNILYNWSVSIMILPPYSR